MASVAKGKTSQIRQHSFSASVFCHKKLGFAFIFKGESVYLQRIIEQMTQDIGSNHHLKIMKKTLTWFFVLTVLGCTTKSSINPVEQESRALCREAADSILAHMPEWKEVYSSYNKAPFHVRQQEYTKTVLSVIAVKGKDTLEIRTDQFQWDYKGNSLNKENAWVGEIGRIYPYEENIAIIKRHNLLMKELFKGVPGFTLEVHNNLIRAKYVKFKPKEPSTPLEEYGLTDEDVPNNEVDTVLL